MDFFVEVKLVCKLKYVKELAKWTTKWEWVRVFHAQGTEYEETQSLMS